MWIQAVERAVQGGIRHGSHHLRNHGSHIVKRLKGLFALVNRPGPATDDDDEGFSVELFRDERKGRRDLKPGEGAELFGCIGDELAVEAQDVADVLQLVEHHAAVDVLDGMHAKLEGSHHPEVAAAAANRPEKVLVLLLARDLKTTVSRDHVG